MSWTTMIAGSGVRYTGERQTGTANGSRWWTWASCSPAPQSRPRGIRLASSPFAPAGEGHPGRPECPFLPPHHRSSSSGLTAPGAGLGRGTVLALPGMEPLDLGGELRGPAGQLPGELQRAVIDRAVGD